MEMDIDDPIVVSYQNLAITIMQCSFQQGYYIGIPVTANPNQLVSLKLDKNAVKSMNWLLTSGQNCRIEHVSLGALEELMHYPYMLWEVAKYIDAQDNLLPDAANERIDEFVRSLRNIISPYIPIDDLTTMTISC